MLFNRTKKVDIFFPFWSCLPWSTETKKNRDYGTWRKRHFL